MFMTNIPRRKIYETMLIFEDGMIEMQILMYNKDNFEKYLNAFHDNGYPKMRKSYSEIKALLIMFLQNRKYSSNEEFIKDLNRLKNAAPMNDILKRNPNIPRKFMWNLKKIDFFLNRYRHIPSFFIAKLMWKEFDKFNSTIPLLLEIRRDHMRK